MQTACNIYIYRTCLKQFLWQRLGELRCCMCSCSCMLRSLYVAVCTPSIIASCGTRIFMGRCMLRYTYIFMGVYPADHVSIAIARAWRRRRRRHQVRRHGVADGSHRRVSRDLPVPIAPLCASAAQRASVCSARLSFIRFNSFPSFLAIVPFIHSLHFLSIVPCNRSFHSCASFPFIASFPISFHSFIHSLHFLSTLGCTSFLSFIRFISFQSFLAIVPFIPC